MQPRNSASLPSENGVSRCLYDAKGLTLIELLASVLLLSLIVGTIGSILMMGQKSANDTAAYTNAEQQLSAFASIIIKEGMNSSAVAQNGSDYLFVDNPNHAVLKYLSVDKALALTQSGVEMMRLSNVVDFQLLTDTIPNSLRISIMDDEGELHELANRWTPRKTKSG